MTQGMIANVTKESQHWGNSENNWKNIGKISWWIKMVWKIWPFHHFHGVFFDFKIPCL